jgi:cytochrome c nitrite reductase small subunit
MQERTMDDVVPAVQDTPKRRLSLLTIAPLWAWVALAALVGGIAGLGAFTFAYAQGPSYLTNKPEACANCHIMREYYDGWNRSGHSHVAVCNDCHTPHDNILAKYAVKGLNGFRHSFAFTTGFFEEPIRITPFDRNITQHACLSCHGDLVSSISHPETREPTDCLGCHAGVGHGK